MWTKRSTDWWSWRSLPACHLNFNLSYQLFTHRRINLKLKPKIRGQLPAVQNLTKTNNAARQPQNTPHHSDSTCQ
jgi:hypothetical protein